MWPSSRLLALGPSAAAHGKKPGQQLISQVPGAGRNMHIARALDKFAQEAKRFVNVLEAVFGEDLLPFGGRFHEVTWERRLDFRPWDFGLENFFKNPAHLAGMTLILSFETGQIWESHQSGEPFTRVALHRDRVRLTIVFHLKTVLDIAKETISLG